MNEPPNDDIGETGSSDPPKSTPLVEWANLLKTVVTTLGIIVGGIWTIVVFSGTKQKDTALASLSEIQMQAQIAAMDLEKRRKEEERKATMTPTMRIMQLPWKHGRRLVKLQLVFENPGAEEVDVPIDNAIFHLRQVENVDEGGNSVLADPRKFIFDGEDTIMTGVTVPGRTATTLEAIQLVEPGFYLVRFRVTDPLRKGAFYDVFQYVLVTGEQRDEKTSIEHGRADHRVE